MKVLLNLFQTLAEDELRSGTPAESVADGSELNESFIFQSEKNGKIVRRKQSQKGLNSLFHMEGRGFESCPIQKLLY